MGRLHPLILHFPIGLLVGAFVLEIYAFVKKQKRDYSPVVFLGAGTALAAAIMGQLLFLNADYQGELINKHRLLGWITAGLSMVTAYLYWSSAKSVSGEVNRFNLPKLKYLFLALTVGVIGFTGHFGASVTHGKDYLSQAFTKEAGTADYTQWAALDSLSDEQKDELNLEVRAIFAHHCYQCHSTEKRKSGLALDHEEGVFAGGDYGPVLVKGSSADSELIRRLRLARSDEESMPPKGKILPPGSIEVIERWINEGAPWAEAGTKIFREASIELIQPVVPKASGAHNHPIDRFVDQYFKENNIKWNEPIDDRRFVRRVYLDAIGLLPDPKVVQDFVKDKDPDKRTRIVQSLLADKKNYTQHWLSFWNDLLRNDYTGPGFITNGRKQITNWLYRSLEEEKPYDQMVSELLNPTEESEGFIKGIQWRGVVNASQRTELQAAQNISQSLLGLNLKCASCHNSFVNNLTLDQAYGFANIFASDPLEVFRCDKPTGRIAKTSFIYPQLGVVIADSLVDRLRQLADVMVQPENGRLYRTVVNRYWNLLFGRGIVTPVDEMDRVPWSQELLDWLAADFINNGYSLTHLLETIMTSKTYQLSAHTYPSTNYLASEKFVFQGPAVRRLSAEQLADAISQTIHPLYYGMAFLPDESEYQSQWIWYQDILLDRGSMPLPGARYFRKKFSTKQVDEIVSADVLITADHSFELYINGQKIGDGDNWKQVKSFNLPIELIQKDNLISVKGVNDGTLANPAGLLFALRLNFKEGQPQLINSDRSWMSTDSLPVQDWKTLDFDETDWKEVGSKGSSGSWGLLPNFTFAASEEEPILIRASLVKQDPFMQNMGRPTRENVSTSREEATTLLQSLMLTNNDFLFQNIQAGAKLWVERTKGDLKELIDRLYLHALGRSPSKKEQKIILKQLELQDAAAGVEDLIWAVILLPEFQFL